MSLELANTKPQELTRLASDVAGLCKEIVVKTALEIQGRKYVRVEGWQSIATAHGCIASSRDVKPVYAPTGTLLGYSAIGEIRQINGGQVIGTAEGFVGADETTWFGGVGQTWDKVKRQYVERQLPKRADYAIRAMCQTRAISRACRAAFAHVVVLMDQNLDTTPAEEVDENAEAHEFFDKERDRKEAEAAPDDSPRVKNERIVEAVVVPSKPAAATAEHHEPEQADADGGDWREVVIHYGKNKGTALGNLSERSLAWYWENFAVQDSYEKDGKRVQCSAENVATQESFRAALDEAGNEFGWGK